MGSARAHLIRAQPIREVNFVTIQRDAKYGWRPKRLPDPFPYKQGWRDVRVRRTVSSRNDGSRRGGNHSRHGRRQGDILWNLGRLVGIRRSHTHKAPDIDAHTHGQDRAPAAQAVSPLAPRKPRRLPPPPPATRSSTTNAATSITPRETTTLLSSTTTAPSS